MPCRNYDYATARRMRNLSNSQPLYLKFNWPRIGAIAAVFAIGGLIGWFALYPLLRWLGSFL